MANTKNELLLILGLALCASGMWNLLGKRGGAEAPAEPPDLVPQKCALTAFEPARELEARSLSSGLHERGQWRGKSQLIDLNADGALDIVSSLHRWAPGKPGEGLFAWLGDGQGHWTKAIDGLPRTLGYGGSHVADANGDGHLDLAFSAHNTAPHVFLGDGSGSWRNVSEGLAIERARSDVALGDVDGDGIGELVSIGFSQGWGGLHVHRFDPEAERWSPYATLLDDDVFGTEVELFDLDADGTLEIVAATEIGLRIWRATPDGFEDWSRGFPTPAIGGCDLGVDARDIDADGDLEILLSGISYEGHPPLCVFDWKATHWACSELPGADPLAEGSDGAVFDAVFAQLDGEGPLEVLAGSRNGISVLVMDSGHRFERIGRISGTEGVVNLAAGDVNGDGRDEVLYVGGRGLRVLELVQPLSAGVPW